MEEETARTSITSKQSTVSVKSSPKKSSIESAERLSNAYAESEREHWSNRIEFVLSILGYAVGLGNVWRFPTLAYGNGGGAFLIPYTISLLVIGLPIFVIELVVGQFTSCGTTTCWEFCPVIQGIGVAMATAGALVSIYYNMIIGWAMYFFFASFTTTVPWVDCKNAWNTNDCIDTAFPAFLSKKCRELGGTWKDELEKCSVNGSLIKPYNGTPVFPAAEYFSRYVLNYTDHDLENIGPMQYRLTLCLFLAWILVACCLIGGIKTSGKVVYVTAVAPYFMLAILLIRGLLMDGAVEGIKFYLFQADFSRLSKPEIWQKAATQIFFSLSASMGGLMALASYNDFKNNILTDAFVVCAGNSLTSIFAGFVIFAFLGGLANIVHVDINEVAKGGPTLVFGIYPMALTHLPGTQFWSILFFLMLVFLGIDSEMVLVETAVTSLVDTFTPLRKYRRHTLLGICILFLIIGLPLSTRGGLFVLDLMDSNVSGWNLLLIATTECVAASWIYGADRFLQDIETMTGTKFCKVIPFSNLVKTYFKVTWLGATPALCMAITIFSWLKGVPPPIMWQRIIANMLTGVGLALGFVFSLHAVSRSPGVTWPEKFKNSFKPSKYWGPSHYDDRKLVQKYSPGLILAPLGEKQPGYKEEKVAPPKRPSQSRPSRASIPKESPTKEGTSEEKPTEESGKE